MNKDIMERTEKDWLDWLLEKKFYTEQRPAVLNDKYKAEYGRMLQVVGSNWAMIFSRLERYRRGKYTPSNELPPWLRKDLKSKDEQMFSKRKSVLSMKANVITDKDQVAEMFRAMDEKAAMKKPYYQYGLVGTKSQIQSYPEMELDQEKMEGVEKMAKGRKMEEKPVWRSYDEVMSSVMEVCEEGGRVLSERALKKSQWLDYEEVVAVIGKGSPRLAMDKINQQWNELHPKTKESQKLRQQTDEKNPGRQSGLWSEEVAPEPIKKRIRLKMTIEDLYRVVCEIREHYGLEADQYPSDAQIKAYSKEHRDRCPSHSTFYNRLGPRGMWAKAFADAGLSITSVVAVENIETNETPNTTVANVIFTFNEKRRLQRQLNQVKRMRRRKSWR